MINRVKNLVQKHMRYVRHFVKSQPLTVQYGIDGILALGAVSIAANNNNLFAQRMGANEFHLSMLQFLPQIITLFLLIPAGMLTDSLKNKRIMLSAAMFAAGVFYTFSGLTAFIPVGAIYFLLITLALANVSVTMANLSWQAYFPEVVEDRRRNDVLTFRARMGMIIQLIMPLSVGGILTAISEHGVVAAHQFFYILAAAMMISNAFYVRRIKASHPAEPKRISFREMKIAGRRLIGNKRYMVFCLVVLALHMGWQLDWTMYFVGQVNYLHMNPFLISLAPVGAMLAQLLTLKFWSRNNAKQGVELPVVYGMLGLTATPIGMILGVTIGGYIGITVFLIIHFAAHLAFANITLNLFQCLLKVVDEEYRSFSISIYTCMITASNAVMPVVGVALYRALGGNQQGLIGMFAIMFALRLIAAGLWMLRLWYMKASENGEES